MGNYTQNATQTLRRKKEQADRRLTKYRVTQKRVQPFTKGSLRVIPLGGQDGIGEKNMIVVEYEDSAIILDCGFSLGIDLPGINYAIPAVDYLETIRHKIKGYVISHGHLDHIGGLIHILPDFPAPVYGSRFTIGMVEAQFEKAEEKGVSLTPDTVVMDMDAHQRINIGPFAIELVRVTHAIPESSAIVIDTPVGRLINTGDFRLDPEPLDKRPSDIQRLRELGDEGVLMLMSESTNTTKLGRTPTEHTLEESFDVIIGKAHGRVIIGVFSTNMNRIQMIITAAHKHGRKVALDGRSMLSVAELAVRLGSLKIPKGVLVPLREAANLPDKKVIIVCTGGQGEPGAALSRMAIGDHRMIKLKPSDSVVISSTPIPGNEQSYAEVGDALASMGVTQYRHPTHEIDGSGPLHVSGHASRDEHAEMIQLTRPRYLMPIYGGPLVRKYHRDIGLAEGIPQADIIMADNGSIVELTTHGIQQKAKVTSGSRLVDQTGSVVPDIVTKDRMLLHNDGFMVVVVTTGPNGTLIKNPDIVTRGHISIQQNSEHMDGVRQIVRKALSGRVALKNRVQEDVFKDTLQKAITDYIYQETGRTPFIVPVLIKVGRLGQTNRVPRPVEDVH